MGGALTGPRPAAGPGWPEGGPAGKGSPGTGPALLPREFFKGSSLRVAPRLLGCVLEHQTPEGTVAAVLTEVEAYEGSADPASHCLPGPHRA